MSLFKKIEYNDDILDNRMPLTVVRKIPKKQDKKNEEKNEFKKNKISKILQR